MSTLVRALIQNAVVVSAVESKDIVRKAIEIHNLSPVAAAALGRCLTMAALMGSELKNPQDYLTAVVAGDGPLGSITVCADGKNHVKGTVENPVVPTQLKPNGHLDVGAAVGSKGRITVIKDIGLKQPYIGTSQLVSGEIAQDFALYYATSEQQPCGITLGVGLQNNTCKSAGGVMVQVLPNCPQQLLEDVETVMYAMDEMSYQFDGSTSKEVVQRFFGRFNPRFTDERTVTYKCDCSLPRIRKVIAGLGQKEAQSILDEVGKVEICCHFCGKKYAFYQKDLDEIFAKPVKG